MPSTDSPQQHSFTPNPATVIEVMKAELFNLYERSMALQALVQDVRDEAVAEIASRDSVILALRKQVQELGGVLPEGDPEDEQQH